eukprot:SAG31_NODE_17951_length_652_cov_0.750452_2_plen_75_part_01
MTVWLLYGPPAAVDVACTMTELFGHVSTEPQRLSEAKRWYVSPTRTGEPPQVVWFCGRQPLLAGVGLMSNPPQSG